MKRNTVSAWFVPVLGCFSCYSEATWEQGGVCYPTSVGKLTVLSMCVCVLSPPFPGLCCPKAAVLVPGGCSLDARSSAEKTEDKARWLAVTVGRPLLRELDIGAVLSDLGLISRTAYHLPFPNANKISDDKTSEVLQDCPGPWRLRPAAAGAQCSPRSEPGNACWPGISEVRLRSPRYVPSGRM